MPSANNKRVSRLARALPAWILIAVLLGAGSGAVSYSFNHGIYGSETTVLAPYNGFHPTRDGFYGPVYGNGVYGCQPYQPCQQDYVNPCAQNPICNDCATPPATDPCGNPVMGWGSYYSWGNPYFYGPVPKYFYSNPVWFQSHFKFQGDTYHAGFSLSAPINAVDPYSYAIEVQLYNRHAQHMIMELTIDAPDHLLIFVSGTGSVNDATPTADGTWIFTLPAVSTVNSGLYITVTDPSQMEQFYILSGDISPLRGA